MSAHKRFEAIHVLLNSFPKKGLFCQVRLSQSMNVV